MFLPSLTCERVISLVFLAPASTLRLFLTLPLLLLLLLLLLRPLLSLLPPLSCNHSVYTFGSTVFAGIVNSMHMRCGLETLTWTWLQLVIFSISFAYFFIFLSVYSQLPLTQASESTGFFYMVGVRLVRIPAFWLLSFILVPISSVSFWFVFLLFVQSYD